MSFFSRMSLQARVFSVGVILPGLLIAALLWMNATDSREKAVASAVDKARSICLAVESAREQKQDEWETGVARTKPYGRFVYQVKWPDGVVRKGTREIVPDIEEQAVTVTFRKTGS